MNHEDQPPTDYDRQLADEFAGYWRPVNSELSADDSELGGEGGHS